MKENLELVIFDMDGLMFDTERVFCDAMFAVAKELQVEVDEHALYSSLGTSSFRLEKFFYQGIPDGVDLNRMIKDIVDESDEEMFLTGVPKKEGLDELMALLKENEIRMAVATSTRIERAGKLLESAGVMPMLEFVVTGPEVKRGKPYPDIFLKACEKAGVEPEKALVLEDSMHGGRAARAAGIRYIIIPDINQPPEDVVDSAYAVVDSLFDVSKLIFS